MEAKARVLKGQVSSLKAAGGPQSGREGGHRAERPCGYCHELGHYARDCPKKKAEEEAKAKAESEE